MSQTPVVAIEPQVALIYTMVLVSAADGTMTDAELAAMGRIVQHLPAFEGFDADRLVTSGRDCARLLRQVDGFEAVAQTIQVTLVPALAETAYALACDIAAADGAADREERHMLELLRQRLELSRDEASALEKGANARFTRILAA
ncbi:tellurite resistance TerB family protein [Marinivivus vitaminiproducens]|uniref:tellurite resistance TerB family protein n=1 Tax=Marinivivus vitaminiproducens TaxID=3035935 RepID=UPI00279A640E|nr:tellurite resistance TerB family protein [Geminicoccaceae bacterium SCSIO 64248]